MANTRKAKNVKVAPKKVVKKVDNTVERQKRMFELQQVNRDSLIQIIMRLEYGS